MLLRFGITPQIVECKREPELGVQNLLVPGEFRDESFVFIDGELIQVLVVERIRGVVAIKRRIISLGLQRCGEKRKNSDENGSFTKPGHSEPFGEK